MLVMSISACSPAGKISSKTKYDSMPLPAFNKEGHRGARGLVPENTIQSMYSAIDHGVTTVEIDVVYSQDGKVVVSHDLYFHPDFTTTPDGKFLDSKEAQNHLLYKMDYDSIRKYDVGLKPHPGFPQQVNIAAYKPLLSELIDSTDAYARKKGTTILYNIELKLSEAGDGTKHPPVNEFVDGVMDVVREKNLDSRCYLQSFDFRPLTYIHQKYPGIVTAVLIGGGEKRTLDQIIADLGYQPEMFSPHYSIVTPALLDACHKKGMKLIPWTVNNLEDMKRLKAMGVDGIITDYPNYFAEL